MFIPTEFNIPQHLANEQFQFEVLAPNLATLDYEAVMSSKERLRHIFAENDEWPKDSMSFELNKNDLVRHEKEFKAREAFAYAVSNSARNNYIGCVYIDPAQHAGYDCEVYLWVKNSELGLDKALFSSVDNWLQEAWPFTQPAYPGRTIAWSNWNQP